MTDLKSDSKISKVFARQIFDSRGNPTVEVEVTTNDGVFRAAVPSGASTGIYEALELRDGGKQYMGKGVSKAVANVNTIIGPALVKAAADPAAQKVDDLMVKELDGTTNEWGFPLPARCHRDSWCVARGLPRGRRGPKGCALGTLRISQRIRPCLPVPAFNIINGGTHAGNKLPMQNS